MEMPHRMDIPKLALSVAVPQMAGAVGALFTYPAISGWYASLAKPWFTPPPWIFAPVWTFLYLLMGIALYLVMQKSGREAKKGILIFGIQLALNVAWSVLFFGLHNPGAGLVGIVLLWIAIAAAMRQFMKIDPRAAYMLAPYILWVTFAAVLNYYVWILNA